MAWRPRTGRMCVAFWNRIVILHVWGVNPPGRLGSECPVVVRSVSVSSIWTFALAESCSGVRSFPLAELI